MKNHPLKTARGRAPQVQTRLKGAATRHASQAAEKVIYFVISESALCHSERSEESLFGFKPKIREIPRRAARLGSP
jgi:hypothetical protein